MGYKEVWVFRMSLSPKPQVGNKKSYGVLESMGYQGNGLRGLRLYAGD